MKLARNERGFTLIELMVVLIIIGILAAIAIPVMSKQSDKAKNKRAVAELKSMKTIVDIYMSDSNLNPTAVAPPAAADVVVGGVVTAKGVKTILTDGGVTTQGLSDPWGNGYLYTRGADPFKTYVLYTRGSAAATAGDEIKVTESTNPQEGVSITPVATDWDVALDAHF